MNVQCFIKEIGMPREWTGRDNKKMSSYPVILSIPYVNNKGEERADQIIAEMVSANDDYVGKLRSCIANETRVEAQVFLAVKEYNGKKFQTCRLGNIQIMI